MDLRLKVSTMLKGKSDIRTESVGLRDPLARIEGSEENQLFGPPGYLKEIHLDFNGEGDMEQFGKHLDDERNPLRITIVIARVDSDKVRRAIKKLNGADKVSDKEINAWGFGQKQGFDIIRENRVIDQASKEVCTRRTLVRTS